MKLKLVKFICDVCKKEALREDGMRPYPYDYGWIYLHEMNLQIGLLIDTGVGIHRQKENEIHLCSSKCYLKFVKNLIGGKIEDERTIKSSRTKK